MKLFISTLLISSIISTGIWIKLSIGYKVENRHTALELVYVKDSLDSKIYLITSSSNGLDQYLGKTLAIQNASVVNSEISRIDILNSDLSRKKNKSIKENGFFEQFDDQVFTEICDTLFILFDESISVECIKWQDVYGVNYGVVYELEANSIPISNIYYTPLKNYPKYTDFIKVVEKLYKYKESTIGENKRASLNVKNEVKLFVREFAVDDLNSTKLRAEEILISKLNKYIEDKDYGVRFHCAQQVNEHINYRKKSEPRFFTLNNIDTEIKTIEDARYAISMIKRRLNRKDVNSLTQEIEKFIFSSKGIDGIDELVDRYNAKLSFLD